MGLVRKSAGRTQKLYEAAASEGIVTVAGHHFFQGLATDWQHANECLRVNYAGEPAIVQEGIGRLVAIADAYMKPAFKRPAPGSSPSGSVQLQVARTRAVAQYPAPAFRAPWYQTVG